MFVDRSVYGKYHIFAQHNKSHAYLKNIYIHDRNGCIVDGGNNRNNHPAAISEQKNTLKDQHIIK